MKGITVNTLIVLFIVVSAVSCSGSSERKNRETATVESEPVLPSRRLIEVLSPADNSTAGCAGRIAFSVAAAAGNNRTDSVQLWVDGKKLSTVTSLPATAEVLAPGRPGRMSFRAVAFAEGSKPQTVTLTVSLLSDIDPVLYRYRVVKSYPHDPGAFTQGLFFDSGFFYEGTGQPGESSLRKVEVASGKVLSQLNLEASLFGEGITLYGDRIYQLTWTSKVGFVYDRESFTQVNKIYYQTEGWGLTTLGDSLVMSDGTNVIWFLDPDFNVLSSVEVWDNKGRVDRLNELEMINGELWANIWQTDRIARIDPATGKVLGYVDLANILPRNERTSQTDVLNGIAWDKSAGRLFVTGKYWPKVYEITVTPQQKN